jgi:hypothetical protein
MSNSEELKAAVHLERVVQLLNENAELRIDLHLATQEKQELESRVQELEKPKKRPASNDED